MTRVAIFIDGSNFYFALKRNNLPNRVDYYQLGLALAGPTRTLYRVYYYNVAYDPAIYPERAKQQQSFHDSLDRTPFVSTRYGRVIPDRQGMGFHEKGVDVRLASEAVYYAARGHYDVAVFLSEDQDFAPVMQTLRELGVQVEIGAFRDLQTRELVRAADHILNLSEILANNPQVFPQGPDRAAATTPTRPSPLPMTPVTAIPAATADPKPSLIPAPKPQPVLEETQEPQPKDEAHLVSSVLTKIKKKVTVRKKIQTHK